MIERELVLDGVEVSLEIAAAAEALRLLSERTENVDLLYVGGLLEDIANHILDMSELMTRRGIVTRSG